MKAMILAAGLGKRLRPLTNDLPKPLLPVGPHRLIEHHLYRLANAGVRDVIINYSYAGECFHRFIGDGGRYGIRIHYSHEENGPLETGGGIVNVLPLLGDADFIIVNADVLTDFDFGRLKPLDEQMAHLILVDNPKHNRKGDFSLREGLVVESVGDALTYSGIGVLRPKLFGDCRLEAFSLTQLFRKAMANQSVTGEVHKGLWMDVGTPERLEAARSVYS